MKRLTSIVVYILAILSAELMIGYAKHFIHFKTGTQNPYINTLIGMGVIVAVFYPLILIADLLFKKVTKKIVDKAKESFGSKIVGLLLIFCFGFGVLFFLFMKEWYG